MVDYWLDSNVFIEGEKGPYGFDIAPRFWNMLDELIDADIVSCPALVYSELPDVQDDLSTWAKERRRKSLFVEPSAEVQRTFQLPDVQDDLSTWAKERRRKSLFVEPSAEVQRTFQEVIVYVMQRYPENQSRRRFLDRADP